MSDNGTPDDGSALAQAQETIARLTAENERLRRRAEDDRFAEELRDTLTLAAAAGTIAAPVTHSHLLEMIVESAARVISSGAASLFLIDEDAQELIFEVAFGGQAEQVKKFRVPLGHGIAGLVAVTGQAMAVSDAQSDPRQARDIAQSVGYVPNSILCVPLFYHDQIVGVLELLDKQGAPSFSPADMETLGLFANLAAVAIEQSRTHQNLAALVSEVLKSSGEPEGRSAERLHQRLASFTATMEAEDRAYRDALDLAHLVQEIAWEGGDASRAVHTILQGFAGYLRSRPEMAYMPALG